jgi:hypothetical protein
MTQIKIYTVKNEFIEESSVQETPRMGETIIINESKHIVKEVIHQGEEIKVIVRPIIRRSRMWN